MVRIRHLKNAPITEALIDFRVRLPEGFDPEEFSSLREALSDRYPKVERRHQFEQRVELGREFRQHPAEDKGLHGVFFRSEDTLNLAQFTVDGFTFNRLKPYTTWEQVFMEARELWRLYCRTACPEAVTRIAVRYINHLRIPQPISDIAHYISSPPPIPEGCPGSVSSFITKVVVLEAKENLAVNITQALEKDVDLQFVTVILDIEAYKRKEFHSQDDELWATFEALRELKNRIFFGSVTEKTVRLFE